MNMVCAGFGGQGALTAGLIVGELACERGKNVTWLPSYGSEMRGGTANCAIKIEDGRIASPFIKEIDILLAMNTPSLVKFEPMVKSGGTVLANASLSGEYPFRRDVRVWMAAAAKIAEDLHNPRGANLVMLGVLARSGAAFGLDDIRRGAEAYFLGKGHGNTQNYLCIEHGYGEAVEI